MKLYFIVLISLKLIQAKINLDINAGESGNPSDVSISYSGEEKNLITDSEARLFNIDNENLKEAIYQHYGKKPNNVYLKGPTPWGDLYKKYNWKQVTRKLSIKSAKLKSINKTPLLVLSHDFENSSNKTIKVNTGISHSVENTVATSWSIDKDFTVSQEIEYSMNVIFASAKGVTGFSLTTSWGKSEEKSEAVTIGATSAVEAELKPGQAATAILKANRGHLEVEVVYKMSLSGNVAVNYKKKHNNHHFWGPSIKNVLKSAGKSNEVTFVEIVKVAFYSDASLKVYDKVTKQPL